MTYDPEKWFETVSRTLKEYVEANINTRVYSVVMEFPGSIVDSEKLPMKKTLIHFELDALDSAPIGMGDNAFAENYDATDQTITPQYAAMQVFTYDVGVWASDASGGVTQRMRARQALEFLFGINNGGIERLREFSDGGDGMLEIVSFTGGRFVLDRSANDTRLYRMVDCQLVLRVYSRTPLEIQTPIPTIETQLQDQSGLSIIG